MSGRPRNYTSKHQVGCFHVTRHQKYAPSVFFYNWNACTGIHPVGKLYRAGVLELPNCNRMVLPCFFKFEFAHTVNLRCPLIPVKSGIFTGIVPSCLM